MLPFLIGALGWGKNNIKWIAIGIGAIAVSVFVAHYTITIKQNASLKYENTQLEENVKSLRSSLETERDLNKISLEIIQQQQEDNATLESQFNSVTKNLPTDSEALAPDSIRETIRRLREKL